MSKVKMIAGKLPKVMETNDLYNYLDGLLGFYHSEPFVFLERAMSLDAPIEVYDLPARAKLLEGVSVYYMSESLSKYNIGWVDKGYCLSQFFTEESIMECRDWEVWSQAISYQCNVAGKVYRMSALISDSLKHIRPDRKVVRSMLYTAQAMLSQFYDHMMDNIKVCRMTLEDLGHLSEFNLWYVAEGRRMMCDTEAKDKPVESLWGSYWIVPKLDDFFRGDVSVQKTYISPVINVKGCPQPKYFKQSYKEQKEIKIREHAIKMLVKDLKMAWEMIQEDKSGGVESA